MPELPEVETVRRHLAGTLPGRQVADVEVLLPRIVRNAEPGAFAAGVRGRRFAGVGRRGKFLLLDLDDRSCIVVHLRMTGRLTVDAQDAVRHPHTRVVFVLEGGDELRFTDTRTLGTVHWLSGRNDPAGPPGLARMGVEPLSEEFTPQVLASLASGRRAPIKAFLLDQRQVAGLGNIYADEALFRAGIDPRRPAGSLSAAEIERLWRAVRAVLGDALANGGTTIRDYVNGEGAPGRFQEWLAVYGRSGRPCPRCGTAVARIVRSGRSWHWCPGCQR
ncbi:MAG: bifunctional DNA-formamidopyrimidine glycosylase/DNA-(apurinic or apyrimidinic site) lyase [Firmicutes bacterium]|nr:bifunctional DNA-formamidopyrimidine glycosylase/DNA-(apurinic or apyrimidinic site) lyase [Bacillota bacterium]